MNGVEIQKIGVQREYKWYFIQLSAIIFTLMSVFFARHNLLPLTHYTIPDSGYYENWVFFPYEKGISTGFLYLNTFLYSIGVQSLVFYNSFLLLGSIYLCAIFEPFSPRAVTLARATIALNPYLLISIIGPTKEINLIFFSLAAFYLFLKDSYILKIASILPAVATMAIRPQFGYIILAAFACSLLLKFIKSPISICLLIIVAFLILNSIPVINSFVSNSGGEELEFFSTSIYYEIALILKAMQENPALQVLALMIKVVLVMFAPIARPNTIFSPFVPLLDWGYTFMGWFLFPLNLSFLLLFLKKKATQLPRLNQAGQLLLIYAFLGAFSVVISPIIQARYLFPYAPMIAACFALHTVKVRNRILIFSLALILLSFVLTAIFMPKYWMVPVEEGFVFVSWI